MLGATVPSYCSTSGTPLQTPVVEGNSFGFSVSTNDKASTVVVGQPDATDSQGIVYAYNQIKLCAFQSYQVPTPPASPSAPPGLLGMMTALSRDGKWLAVAGTLESDSTIAQVYVYQRQTNDSTGNFQFVHKLPLAAAPAADAATAPGKVYSGSLSISRDGRLVLASWSVYGDGRGASSDDPYGPPATAAFGSAQLFRRNATGRYSRAQADLAWGAPPLTRTQFLGANSYVVADGSVLAVATRVVDTTQTATGVPAILIYQRTTTGAFVYATALKAPGCDGTFAMTESGSHLVLVRSGDVYVYVREGDVATGKFVYNKRCTLSGTDMNLAQSELGWMQCDTGRVVAAAGRRLRLACQDASPPKRDHSASRFTPQHTMPHPPRLHQACRGHRQQRDAAPGHWQLPGQRVCVEHPAGRQACLQRRHLPRQPGRDADGRRQQPVWLRAVHGGDGQCAGHRRPGQQRQPRGKRAGCRHQPGAPGAASVAGAGVNSRQLGWGAVQPQRQLRQPGQQLLCHQPKHRAGLGAPRQRGSARTATV